MSKPNPNLSFSCHPKAEVRVLDRPAHLRPTKIMCYHKKEDDGRHRHYADDDESDIEHARADCAANEEIITPPRLQNVEYVEETDTGKIFYSIKPS